MIAVLEGGEWSATRPGRTLPPGKTWYPFYSRLGGPQGRSGRAENLVPTGIRSRTVQPVVSRYTELPDPLYFCVSHKIHIGLRALHLAYCLCFLLDPSFWRQKFHKLSRNVTVSSDLEAHDDWREANSIQRTHTHFRHHKTQVGYKVGSVGKRHCAEAGRSRFRLHLKSPLFSNDLILPAARRTCGRLGRSNTTRNHGYKTVA